MPDAPDPTRAEEAREIIADLERELGVTGTANVLRRALAIAKEACRAGEHSGFSGAGVRSVIGSRQDIDLVRRWCEQAATIPQLQDRIKSAEARAARADAVKAAQTFYAKETGVSAVEGADFRVVQIEGRWHFEADRDPASN